MSPFMRRLITMGTLSALSFASACRGPAPATAPSPDAPATVVVERAEPSPPDPEPADPAVAPLPKHLLLPKAVSVTVIDIAALRALGFRDALAAMAQSDLDTELGECGERLIDETERIVTSREASSMDWVMVVEQPIPIESLLDCLAAALPEAEAKAVGDRAALEISDGNLAMEIEGTLVIGSESGLAKVLGLPDLKAPDDEELRRQLDGTPMGQLVELGDVTTIVSELELGPGVLISSRQHIPGLNPLGDTSFVIRRDDDGLHLRGRMAGFGAELGALSSMGEPGSSFIQSVADQLRTQLVESVSDPEQARAVTALFDRLRTEQQGNDLHVRWDVADLDLARRAIMALFEAQNAEK
jgi:hypothetical protein